MLGPVFEEDVLESRVQILERIPLAHGDLARLQLETFAVRGPEAPESTQEGRCWIGSCGRILQRRNLNNL